MLAIILIGLWTICLIVIRPSPKSLKEKSSSKRDDFKKIRGTYLLGVGLIIVFWITSNGEMVDSSEFWMARLGVNNIEGFDLGWIAQAFTHIFLHSNWLHLLTNLSFLGLMSIYERRVGARRFMSVFIISGVLSAISVWFSEPMLAMGASGGLMGLAAGYMVDVPRQSTREYLAGVGTVLLVFAIMTIYQKIEFSDPAGLKIDNLGHLFGLVSGLIYCKLRPVYEK